MELDAKTLLRRFCFLGTFEPVYMYHHKLIEVENLFPNLLEVCQALDDADFVLILKELLHDVKLVRRDEAIFALATYLSGDINIGWKTNVRKAFPILVASDSDLFLFCKYASLIQQLGYCKVTSKPKRKAAPKKNLLKGFSRTHRKAIFGWYEQQTSETLREMWLMGRGAHGFTHKALIKMCYVTDEAIGKLGAVVPFFKCCKMLLDDAKSEEEGVPPEPSTSAAALEKPKAVASTPAAPEKSQATAEVANDSIVLSISKLRTTQNIKEALKIIRRYKLHYDQVPPHLLRHAAIMEVLIPTMSYLQLLKCWRRMARLNLFDNPKIFRLCQTLLDNKKQLHRDNIHPVVFLMRLKALGIRHDLKQLPGKKVDAAKMEYLQKLYKQSFGQNQGTGLRVHITINFQANYKKKLLKNHKKLSFSETAVALAFGYFKKESQVDVFHWIEENMKVAQIPWTKSMNIERAMKICDEIENTKNAQRLVAPVIQALASKQVYDVFIVIVPTAGRGNPEQNSKFLCKFLDRYRETKNAKAKYVIVELLKFKKSMNYSDTRKENILEICGLDEYTTDLINNFALNRFG